MRVGTEQRCERSEEKNWFVPPLVTFWGTLVANEVNKNLPYKFVGGKQAVWSSYPRAPSHVPGVNKFISISAGKY